MRGRVATSRGMTAHVDHIEHLDPTALSALTAAPGVVLVDFTAERCAPCRAMQPILAALATEYARFARIVAVDCDREPELAEQFLVRSMPTMVVLRDGREVGRLIGSRPRRVVAELLDRAIDRAAGVAVAR